MRIKTFIQIFYVILLTLINYLLILEYQAEFVPDNFDIVKIIDIKYRCIQFFSDNYEDKYMANRCKDHYHNYIDFKLKKANYAFMYYMYNLIMIGVYMLFHILF
jgi:hypothetical protein